MTHKDKRDIIDYEGGYTMTICNQYGVSIEFDVAVNMMDDNIREALHAEGIDDAQEFFNCYAVAHLNKFGESWELDKPNPVY